MISIPIFFCVKRATIRCISSTATGSTPANGSSRRIKLGSVANARAISVRRLSPPESKSPLFFRIWFNPNSSIRDYILIFCSFFDNLVICKTLKILSSIDNFLNTEASCAR